MGGGPGGAIFSISLIAHASVTRGKRKVREENALGLSLWAWVVRGTLGGAWRVGSFCWQMCAGRVTRLAGVVVVGCAQRLTGLSCIITIMWEYLQNAMTSSEEEHVSRKQRATASRGH